MPSKFCRAAARSGMSAAIGWVVGSRSAAYAHSLREPANATQASSWPAASSATRVPMYSAKDSFSHRSSHQTGVTRSPNHMCAISCRIVVARASSCWRVGREVNRYFSLNVTQPGFSIAPMLFSGANSWSYLVHG